MLICGVDEAGRGPVLGPLVMAGVLVREEDIVKLEKIGVKDSKLLTREKREELFGQIKKIAADYRIVSLSPAEIDKALRDARLNLNWLEARTSAEIVNQLKPGQAILDCPSPNTAAYKNYFRRRLISEIKSNIELIVEHKADLNYAVVGAASILAKVTRDGEIEKLKKKAGADFGSGYLTDEKTQNFLKMNFDNKELEGLFRKKWSPYSELVKEKAQRKLDNF